jgi:hypothetical protein
MRDRSKNELWSEACDDVRVLGGGLVSVPKLAIQYYTMTRATALVALDLGPPMNATHEKNSF